MLSEIVTLKNSTDKSTTKESMEETLQKIVNGLTRGLETLALGSTDFDEVERLFREATTLEETLGNISVMVDKLVELVETNDTNRNMKESIYYADKEEPKQKSMSSDNYDVLEKMLQKYEAEIREHIRVEQQMKIYSESLEDRINELKAEVSSNKRSEELVKELKRCHEELEQIKNDKQLLERRLLKYKRKENFKSVCLDRTVKNKSMDHVS